MKYCVIVQGKIFRVRPITKVIVMFNWEGTLVCAMPEHTDNLIYGHPKEFVQISMVIEKLRNCPNIIPVISSSTEEAIINKWVEKTGNDVSRVLGRESGSKVDHVSMIKKEFPGAVIVFVSDSPEDMSLPVDMTFGVNVPTNKNSLFLENKAVIVSSRPVCLVWAEYCFGKIGIKV